MVGHAPFGGNGALSVGVMRDSEKAYLFRVCSSSDGAIVTIASQGSKISPGQRHSTHWLDTNFHVPARLTISPLRTVVQKQLQLITVARLLAFQQPLT